MARKITEKIISLNKISKEQLRVKRITESIIGLPTLPSVVSKMIELVDNPRTSAASLARLIYTDQAMTAKILKMANSAYYGFPREISTVNLAIVVLGFNTVKDMGLSISVLNAFKGRSESKYFDISKFWEHSIASGVAARFLARLFNYRVVGEAFVAGLLHDVGKVVLSQYMNLDFMEIMRRVHEEDADLNDAEIAVIGTTHSQVGGWLAEKWNLPPSLTEAITLHHLPLLAEKNRDIVLLTYFADYIVRLAGIGESGNKKQPVMPDDIKKALSDFGVSVDDENIQNIKMEFILELDKAEAFFTILKNNTEQ